MSELRKIVREIAEGLETALGNPLDTRKADPLTPMSVYVLGKASNLLYDTDDREEREAVHKAFEKGIDALIAGFYEDELKIADGVNRGLKHFARYCKDAHHYNYQNVIDGMRTDQLETMMDAFLEWPIGDREPKEFVAMRNQLPSWLKAELSFFDEDRHRDHKPQILNIARAADDIIDIAASVADIPRLAYSFAQKYLEFHPQNKKSVGTRLGQLALRSSSFTISDETFQNMRRIGLAPVDVMLHTEVGGYSFFKPVTALPNVERPPEGAKIYKFPPRGARPG